MKKTERTPQTQTTSTSNQSSFPNAGPIPNFSKHQAFAPALPRLTASTIPVPKYEEFYELTEAAKREKENNRKYLMSVSDGRLMQLKALYSSNRWFKDSKATQMQRQWQKDDAKKYTFSANVISGADYEGYGKLINGQTITNRYEKNPKTSKKLLENKIKTYYNHFISEDQQEKDTVIHRNVAYTGDINQPANAMDFSYNKLTPTICYPAELAKRREALKDIFMSRKLVYEALVAGKENITGLTLDDAQDAYMRALRDLLKLADLAQALKKQLEGSKQGIIAQWTAACTAAQSQGYSLDWINNLYTRAQTSLDKELEAIGQVFIDSGIYGNDAWQARKAKINQDISNLNNRNETTKYIQQSIESDVNLVNTLIKNNVNPMLLPMLKKYARFVANQINILSLSCLQLQQKHPEDEEKAGQITDLKISINRLQNLYTYLNGQNYTPTKEDLETLNECLRTYSQQLGRDQFNLEEDIATHQGKLHIPQHLVAIDYAKVRLKELETQAENKKKDEYIDAHNAEYDKLLVDDKFLAFIILVAQLQKQARSGQPAQKTAAGQSSQGLLKQQQAEFLNRMLSHESLKQMTTMFNDMTTQAQMNAAAIPEGLAPDKSLEMMNMNLKVNDTMAAFIKAVSTGMLLYNPAITFAAKNLITVKHNRQERLKQYETLGIKKHLAISKHLHGLDPAQAFRSLGAGFGLVETAASATTSAAKGLGIFGAEQINLLLSLIPGINAITGAFNSIASGIDWYRSYKKMKVADKEIIIRLDRIKKNEKNNKNPAVRLLIDGKETSDKAEKEANPSIDELKKRIGETKTTKDKKTRIKAETSILQTRVNELLKNKDALSAASVKDLNEILSFYHLRRIHDANRHAHKFGTISSVAGALAGGMQAALAVSLFLNPATALPALALGGLLIPVSVGLSVANGFVQQNAIHKVEQLSKDFETFNVDIPSAQRDILKLKPLSELKDENQHTLSLEKIADTLSVGDISAKLQSLNDNDKNLLFREYVPVYRKLSAMPGVDIIAVAAEFRPKKDEVK